MGDTHKLLLALIDALGFEVKVDRKMMLNGVNIVPDGYCPTVLVNPDEINRIEHVVDYKVFPKAQEVPDTGRKEREQWSPGTPYVAKNIVKVGEKYYIALTGSIEMPNIDIFPTDNPVHWSAMIPFEPFEKAIV